jgi:hypothetical protein
MFRFVRLMVRQDHHEDSNELLILCPELVEGSKDEARADAVVPATSCFES